MGSYGCDSSYPVTAVQGPPSASRYPRDDTSKIYSTQPCEVQFVDWVRLPGKALLPLAGPTQIFAVGVNSSEELATSWGGYAERATADDALGPALNKLAADLTSQYAITMRPASLPKDGAKLRVESTRPGVTIRAPERVK